MCHNNYQRVGNKKMMFLWEKHIEKLLTLGIEGRVEELPKMFNGRIISYWRYNSDENIHGIMMSGHASIWRKEILENRPQKDIDGMTPGNLEKIFEGDDSGFSPCTPKAVIEMWNIMTAFTRCGGKGCIRQKPGCGKPWPCFC